jgi:signal transduction histidine kinase
LLVALVKNLLNNATKYNILHGSIDLFTYQEPADAVLRIVNTGRAIPEAEAEALFGRFTRLDSRIDENGYGLGLALVRSVAEAHAGKVEALPGPQGGLEVVVRIPSPSARPVDIS